MGKVSTLIFLLMLMSSLAACRAAEIKPEPIAMSPTVERQNCIQLCFNRYNEAIFTEAEAEVVEAAADRVMEIFRYAFETDWLDVMQHEYERGEWGIENLLALIGDRIAKGRAAGDETYDTALANAIISYRNETQLQILQWIHESIERFEIH